MAIGVLAVATITASWLVILYAIAFQGFPVSSGRSAILARIKGVAEINLERTLSKRC